MYLAKKKKFKLFPPKINIEMKIFIVVKMSIIFFL